MWFGKCFEDRHQYFTYAKASEKTDSCLCLTSIYFLLLENAANPENPKKFLGWRVSTGTREGWLIVKVNFPWPKSQAGVVEQEGIKAFIPPGIYPKTKCYMGRTMVGVSWESFLPCKPTIGVGGDQFWSLMQSCFRELGKNKHSANFGSFWYFETTWGYSELEYRAIRSNSMETSHWDKQVRQGSFFKVTACCKLKAWLGALLSPVLEIADH